MDDRGIAELAPAVAAFMSWIGPLRVSAQDSHRPWLRLTFPAVTELADRYAVGPTNDERTVTLRTPMKKRTSGMKTVIIFRDSQRHSWTAALRPSRVLQMIPAMAAALILTLVPVTAGPCQAEADDETPDTSTLRADAEKTFKEKVGPFVNKYCIDCHGPRPEAGINLRSALRSPGAASSFLHWKKAVANVKVHDMPPDYADEIPTEDERRQFIEWLGKLKYLAPRDPGRS
jgi:mono/diheme cytochrome c family protein